MRLRFLILFQKCSVRVTDRQVELIIAKAAVNWWPRLTAKPQKPAWLKVGYLYEVIALAKIHLFLFNFRLTLISGKVRMTLMKRKSGET